MPHRALAVSRLLLRGRAPLGGGRDLVGPIPSLDRYHAAREQKLLCAGASGVIHRLPLHDETDPSCKVSLKKRTFHCFGGGAKRETGDVIV
jgi:hypothetical protein